MTRQLADIITYEALEYQILRASNDSLYTPQDFGIEVKAPSTGLYRGYITNHIISEQILYLDQMYVYSDTSLKDLPKIGNATANLGSYSDLKILDGIIYEKMGLKSQYSGGVLVGKMSPKNQPIYFYFGIQSLVYVIFEEWVFENGKLVKRTDHSEKMARIKAKLEALPQDNLYKSQEYDDLMEEIKTGYTFEYFPRRTS